MAPAGAKAGRQGDLATKGEVGQDRHCLSPRGATGHTLLRGIHPGGSCGVKPWGGSADALETGVVTITCLPFSVVRG